MIIALKVTVEGKKVILGFIRAGTENASVCKGFFTGLLEKGLTVEKGLLCVMGGSKGIRKTVEECCLLIVRRGGKWQTQFVPRNECSKILKVYCIFKKDL